MKRRQRLCWQTLSLILISLVFPTTSTMSPLVASIRPPGSTSRTGTATTSSRSSTTRTTASSTSSINIDGLHLPPLGFPDEQVTSVSMRSSISSFHQNNSFRDSLQAVQNKVEAWRQQMTQRLRRHLSPEALSVFAGAVSFGSTLALSTTLQQKLLGISTGTPAPVPSLVGVASVCLASTTAHQVALATHAYARTGEWPSQFTLWPRADQSAYLFYRDQVLDLKIVKLPMHSVRIWTMGLVCFKLLGGRFWAVAPSSVTHLGSYARASIPATANYATAQQRLQIERLGRLWGCHTCGSHRWFSFPRPGGVPGAQFVGDHMPPRSVAQQLETSLWYRFLRRKVHYRFYPQCIQCSNKQGSLLSKASAALQTRRGSAAARRLAAVGGDRAASYNHGWQPRLAHWSGGILAAIAVVNTQPADLVDENRWRYAQWQDDLTDLVYRKEQQVQQQIEKRVQSKGDR